MQFNNTEFVESARLKYIPRISNHRYHIWLQVYNLTSSNNLCRPLMCWEIVKIIMYLEYKCTYKYTPTGKWGLYHILTSRLPISFQKWGFIRTFHMNMLSDHFKPTCELILLTVPIGAWRSWDFSISIKWFWEYGAWVEQGDCRVCTFQI